MPKAIAVKVFDNLDVDDLLVDDTDSEDERDTTNQGSKPSYLEQAAESRQPNHLWSNIHISTTD